MAVDQILLELETDKTTVEIPSPVAGTVQIVKPAGSVVAVGDVLARVDAAGAKAAPSKAAKPAAAAAVPAEPVPAETVPAATVSAAPAAPTKKAPAPAAAPKPAPAGPAPAVAPPAPSATGATRSGPAAKRLAEEQGVDVNTVTGSGPGGRVTKTDVAAAAQAPEQAVAAAPVASITPAPSPVFAGDAEEGDDGEVRVRMSRLRRTIADRLVAAQHTAAILTTFNEIDMSATMEMRSRHKELFQKTFGVSLGFMSLFSRACVLALRDVPMVGAQLEGDEIVTNKRVHLGIAASTDRGLVVPVVRNADLMGLSDLEREIARLAGLARDGKITVDDLSGGTFTISNGGVFGSLMSTPILNPPQSGILGLHKIEKRAVVVNDQIVIRPMMYVALSYDHRVVDGREAVTFLVRVKDRIEDPSRLLLEI